MAQSIITARIDSSDKKQFDSFCNDVGISSSAAINMFIKTVIKQHRIPFSIESDPFYSENNMKFLRKGMKELNEGKVVIHNLIEEEDECK